MLEMWIAGTLGFSMPQASTFVCSFERHYHGCCCPSSRTSRVVGIQDGGASSMVASHDTIMQVILACMTRVSLGGVQVLVLQCQQVLSFRWRSHLPRGLVPCLPVWVGEVKGRVQVFMVPGSTPLLILKALKVKMDYEGDMTSVMGESWTTSL